MEDTKINNLNREYLLCTSPTERDKKSETFCMLPWVHMNFMPDSSVIPCCFAPFGESFGNAKENSIQEIWNSEKYKELRKQMLEGKKSGSCNVCYKMEESNISSMRNHVNKEFADEFSIVETTQEDGAVENVNLSYFDVRFSNICNFKCRGCSETLSSAWHEDHEKLYNYKSGKDKVISCTEGGTNNLWDQLATFIPQIKKAYFAGGEPLLIEEHYKTLQILLDHGRNDVPLAYNTNLSVLKLKNYDLIKLWNSFSDISLMVSIDDIEERGEYYRKGTNWVKLINNWDYIKEKCPHIRFSITCTVNVMNVFYLPEIYMLFVKNNYIQSYNFGFNVLLYPEVYRIQVLPKKFKDKLTEKLLASVDKFRTELMPGINHDHYHSNILSTLNFLEKEDHSWQLEEFKKRTNKLDEIRGEDFKKIYPELAELLD